MNKHFSIRVATAVLLLFVSASGSAQYGFGELLIGLRVLVTQAVATANTAVRQQLQCQEPETTDLCAQRVVNQTVNGAYDTAHGTVSNTAGCYPDEADDVCAQRRAAETQAALLTLIDGVKDAARAQARTALGCYGPETDDQCAVRMANEKATYVSGVVIETANQAIALITATEQMAEGIVRQNLGCQAGESNEACAQRVALGVLGQAAATADAAVRQQLQCQFGETTDACAARVVNQTVTGAYNTVHGTAVGAAGCYPGEADEICAQRRAAETQAAILALIEGVGSEAQNQARTALGCQAWESNEACAVRAAKDKSDFVSGTVVTAANQGIELILATEQMAETTVRNALQCQPEESNEACAVRVANEKAAEAVTTMIYTITHLPP